MRIIDKNTDFYDYCARIYPDDLNTFDRRDSYVLTKEEFMSSLYADDFYSFSWLVSKKKQLPQQLVLLQVCNTFWLFVLTITKTTAFNQCADYDIALLAQWKDYDVKREQLKLSYILFRGHNVIHSYDDYTDEKIIALMRDSIHHNNYQTKKVFNEFKITRGFDYKNGEIRHIPILREIGIAALVKPEDIYFALDEYFSKLKEDNERETSVGLTNDEKIVNHGFDTKKSFRGKNK